MAREQPNIGDLLPQLESSDIRQLEEIKSLINENLSTERGSVLLNGLVDYYLENNSAQAMQILSSVREPHDKHLLDKMNDCMTKQTSRLSTLTLLGHVVRKQPSWIHKMARYPLLLSLLKCLKTDSDVVVLITGVLVLITLLPMIPQAGKQHLYEFFDIFGRLASWNLKNPGHVSEVYLIHLHASVYSLFHRLYGMYPCNFLSYLRSHYSMKENLDTFEEVVKPMLEHVRIHPELVTGTKDHELDPTRWKRFEIHDIVIECAKVSLDPKEASCEEGYATMPDHLYPHPQLRSQHSASSPYADFHSSYGSSSSTPFSTPRQPLPPPLSLPPLSGTQSSYRSPQASRRQNPSCELPFSYGGKELWSPSSLCGMATPPSSRGISPNPELSHSASFLPGHRLHSASGGKGTPASSTPATSSPPPTLSDDFPIASLPSNATSLPQKDGLHVEAFKPALVRQDPIRDPEKGGEIIVINNRDLGSRECVSMTLTELSVFMQEQELQMRTEKEREEAAITEELLKITEDKRDLAGLRGFDSPFFHTTETLTGTQGKPLAGLALGGPMLPREPHHSVSTPDRALEKAQGQNGDGDGSRSSPQEQSWSFQPVCPFSPIEHPLHQSPSAPEDEVAKVSDLFSPSPSMKNPSLPYEALFDLALPRAASLFIGRRTSEALGRAPQSDGLEDGEEQLGEGRVSASPLEVLDRLVQQGSDAHDKVLKRLPLPSKSADWTHFGGSAPLDELHTLRSQLLLLHNQLLYERYKREQHAVRNRRLLRRVINATALEEHNNAMKDQLSLQAVDMVSLRESLRVEQQRYRQLWEDRETVVTRLHSQIRQLQQGRDEYYTKNQGLQSKLNEYQKRMNELEADLQRANNKVCHTGHLLNQMTVKLSTSESTQQQMSFLNKQLLLLGEAHKLALQQPQPAGSNGAAEAQMVQASWGKEAERLRQSLLLQGQKLEAAQQRVGELDIQLTKKEHLIAEQKKFLEDVKGQAKGELQASESRYQAQRRVTQLLQKELLQLYSRLEIERPACCTTASAAGGSTSDSGHPIDSSIMEPDVLVPLRTDVWSDGGGRGNGSTLSPWQPKANHPPASPSSNSVNGTEDVPPPLHAPPAPPPPPHDTAPLTVGSYPSAKSFLGMRARELFRNKSESQCDEEPPRLAGLSQGLKTELCVEPLWPTPGEAPCPASDPVLTVTPAAVSKPPPPVCVPAKEHPPDTRPRATKLDVPRRKMGGARGGAGPTAGAARPRQQQQLRIMDYNDMHQDRS
ncbi:TSC complex subunit 1b isoform X2 [Esox lucius]|uniref:TSC complex subunit 1b isoform X2 n=1 Tax=Esox lucius TaxID=8010 RepID=UPI0014775593|nr:TSC complex subunit 1b isoform X2 [Esox lucius]